MDSGFLIGAPRSRWYHTGVWTGSRMLVWGGGLADGGLDDPREQLVAVAPRRCPSRYFHAGVWTGTELVIFGGTRAPPGLPSLTLGERALLRP